MIATLHRKLSSIIHCACPNESIIPFPPIPSKLKLSVEAITGTNRSQVVHAQRLPGRPKLGVALQLLFPLSALPIGWCHASLKRLRNPDLCHLGMSIAACVRRSTVSHPSLARKPRSRFLMLTWYCAIGSRPWGLKGSTGSAM